MSSALSEDIEKDVLPWLQLIEDLRLLKLEVELNIPQICVMGDQSSGKSSVLEALSGIPFPRGTGLVTRCPIRMVMRRARKGESWSAKVSTSINPLQHTVEDVAELSLIIDKLVSEVCTGENGFATDSIIIELTSPDACDLTVVDLPGIIRTVTAGQSVTAIGQVNKLIKSFLMDERTIILAVIPANQDIATVDILERALGVDPSGERTIGVLTKTDLVGPGNEDEVLSVINNIRKPLQLGYIMLKNRSQKDIIENIPTAKARENEVNFFKSHPVYRTCSPNLFGVSNLSKKLTYLLVDRIQRQLAPMKFSVDVKLNEVRAFLRTLPKNFSSAKNSTDRRKLLVTIVQEYVRHLTDCIRGEYRDRVMVRHAELRMYTIALQKFEEFQKNVNATAPKFRDDEFVQLLAFQIDQFRGRELPGFMSSQAFYMCISEYVDQWCDPMQKLLEEVKLVAFHVATKLADVMLVQYPGLKQTLGKIVDEILETTCKKARDIVVEMLNREKDPFTLNDFLQQWVNKIRFDRFSVAVEETFDKARSPSNNWGALKEEVFEGMRSWYRTTHCVSAIASAQDMSAIMEAYWHLSAKRFVDNCCMITDKEMLNTLPAAVQDLMYPFIKNDEMLETFFKENPEVLRQKEEAEDMRDRLLQAAAKLSTISVAQYSTKKSLNEESSLKGSAISTNLPLATNGAAKVTDSNTITCSVPVGDKGIGLVLTTKTFGSTDALVIKGFHEIANTSQNPCQAAGLKVGDRIVLINNTAAVSTSDAVSLIKGAKGTISFTVQR